MLLLVVLTKTVYMALLLKSVLAALLSAYAALIQRVFEVMIPRVYLVLPPPAFSAAACRAAASASAGWLLAFRSALPTGRDLAAASSFSFLHASDEDDGEGCGMLVPTLLLR